VRILIVEDDESIAKLVRLTLERDGHDVASAMTGGEGLELFRAWKPEIVVLDIMLPEMDGRDVAKEIRTVSDVPIIFVTAMGAPRDRVLALDQGADDYITKPFSIDEFAARVRAVGRRARAATQHPDATLRHRDLELDTRELRLTKAGAEITLTKREFEILRMLMAQPGTLVSRSDIANVVWQRPASAATNVLDVHMSSLRHKLGDDPAAYIETVRGEGFRLKAESEAK